MNMRKAVHGILAALVISALTGCASLLTTATSGLADNLNAAILNQDDPETVRDGAPAYLLMVDSFVEGSKDNVSMLRAAAELYAAYGIIFVDDPARAKRLTARSLNYAQQAICASNDRGCGLWDLNYDAYTSQLATLGPRDAPAMFTLGLSWLAYIQAHRDDWAALADLPQAEAALLRVRALDAEYQPSKVEHYLGIMNTLRPPALGGKFDLGRAHYERAIELSGDADLGIKVDFARYYARGLYDRELHDRLLEEVLAADPRRPGLTLFNTLAQRSAMELLESADDYF